MDAITYAKDKGYKLKNIPPSNLANAHLISQVFKRSRQKYFINVGEPDLPIEPNSIYVDADTSRVQYASPFNESPIVEFIDGQRNLVDKFLSLNPKQFGIINPHIDIVFDYNNQLHYLVCKQSIIDVFEYVDDDTARMPLDGNKIVYFDENNPQYVGYGSLNLNNILFASLLYRFNLSGFESNLLTLNLNLKNLHELKDVRALPYKTDYTKTTASELPGKLALYENDLSEYGLTDETSDYTILNISGSDGFTVVESPLNFSKTKSMFNEHILIDRTHPLWESFRVTLQRDIHYSNTGTDISYLDPQTNLSIMDRLLQSIYSWKSSLMIFEYENPLWDSTIPETPRFRYEFALLVGIKTRDYKLTEKIESIFYITAGDNYINNDKFSKKDIFFINTTIKKMLNVYKPSRVHFLDMSESDYGNICKNGLLFGMESDLQNYIIEYINKMDNQFVKTNSKIESLYQLFEKL